MQIEGVADEPRDGDLDSLQSLYFERFPDGRARQVWKGLIYVRVRPTWLRFSDHGASPPRVIEIDETAIARLK